MSPPNKNNILFRKPLKFAIKPSHTVEIQHNQVAFVHFCWTWKCGLKFYYFSKLPIPQLADAEAEAEVCWP